MTYIVIEEQKMQGLVEVVNGWCAKGFIPLGGIAVANDNFIQAMYNEDAPLEDDKVAQTLHDIKDLRIIRYKKEIFDPFTNAYIIEFIYRGVQDTTTVKSKKINLLDETGLAWLVFDKICNP